ncbi:hypothetical protein IWW48_003153 [Coemansia sp. RSA 1200]|nr:hypothetical protein IWW48_003153 [Coemansia sp. RSA 1200]
MTSPSSSPLPSPSPHQMAARLRTRLRLARAAVEREIGHSMAAVVSHTSEDVSSVVPRRAPPSQRQKHAPVLCLRQYRCQLSGSTPRKGSASGRSRLLNSVSALEGSNRFSASTSTATATSTSMYTSTAVHPLDIPSSPPDALRTPTMRPLDYESEAAHTILMLATPPAARAPSPSASPCHRTPVLLCRRSRPRNPNRRLSFTECMPSLSPGRQRHAPLSVSHLNPQDSSSLRSAMPSDCFLNLSQITTAASTQDTAASSTQRR